MGLNSDYQQANGYACPISRRGPFGVERPNGNDKTGESRFDGLKQGIRPGNHLSENAQNGSDLVRRQNQRDRIRGRGWSDGEDLEFVAAAELGGQPPAPDNICGG